MGSPFWVRTLINKTFSQRFFWSRMSRYPLMGRLIDHLLFDGDDIMYLPKDAAIPVNRRVEGRSDVVLPSQVLAHFIRSARYHWIMDFCICRDSTQCKDYPISLGCLFLGQAAMDINPKFGRPVSMDDALQHAARCREAGLVHLIGRNKLDSVWLNVGPGTKLLTVCNCCPCCCLWKVLPVISGEIGDKVTRMPGVSVAVTDECVGCGTCAKDVCFVDAIHLDNNRAVISDACRGCGRCVTVCPKQAIEIHFEGEKAIAKSVERISGLVDLK